MRIYISGPMTGYPELNFPAFAEKAKELRSQGFDVCNPAEHDEVPNQEWSFYLRKDIRLLMDCQALHLLPGWEKSKGAKLEHYIACELGMIIEGSINDWMAGSPNKKGVYRVKSDAKTPNYGFRYWDGDKWGPLWSRRDWCLQSKGSARRNSRISKPVLWWGKL